MRPRRWNHYYRVQNEQLTETPVLLRQQIRELCYSLGWQPCDLATFVMQRPWLTLWAYSTEGEAQEVIAELKRQR